MENWRKNQVDYHHHHQQDVHSKKPPSGSWPMPVPSWEKEFCSKVGTMSWRRLLDAKKLMYYYENVVQWNDSAGEEAFHNAKNRFWAQINGLPCDTTLPDPDIYIDKIDWNSEVDTDLLFDLDREPMVLDDSQKDQKAGLQADSLLFLNEPLPCNGWGDAEEGPLRTANKSSSRPIMEDVNPWECSNPGANGGVEDRTWGNDGVEKRGWNNPTLCTGWGDADGNQVTAANRSSSRPSFGDCNKKADNPWECDKVEANLSGEARTWGNIGDRSQAWNRWDHDISMSESMRSGRSQYMSRYKTSRFQHHDYPTNGGWRNDRGRKRTNFAYEIPVMDKRAFAPRQWNSFHPIGHNGSCEAW